MPRTHLAPSLLVCAVLAGTSCLEVIEAFAPAPGVTNRIKLTSSKRRNGNHMTVFLVDQRQQRRTLHPCTSRADKSLPSQTSLNAIIDVPYGFFTIAGISLGIMNAIMRPYNRQIIVEPARDMPTTCRAEDTDDDTGANASTRAAARRATRADDVRRILMVGPLGGMPLRPLLKKNGHGCFVFVRHDERRSDVKNTYLRATARPIKPRGPSTSSSTLDACWFELT